MELNGYTYTIVALLITLIVVCFPLVCRQLDEKKEKIFDNKNEAVEYYGWGFMIAIIWPFLVFLAILFGSMWVIFTVFEKLISFLAKPLIKGE